MSNEPYATSALPSKTQTARFFSIGHLPVTPLDRHCPQSIAMALAPEIPLLNRGLDIPPVAMQRQVGRMIIPEPGLPPKNFHMRR